MGLGRRIQAGDTMTRLALTLLLLAASASAAELPHTEESLAKANVNAELAARFERTITKAIA